MTLTIPPNDTRLHVFAVNDIGDATLPHQTHLGRLTTPATDTITLAKFLGLETVEGSLSEVFAVADIASIGLRSYLSQAHDIALDTLSHDRAKLDALQGDVLTIPGRAFGPNGATLRPSPQLTHIGSYATAQADTAPRALPKATTTAPLKRPPATGPRLKPGLAVGIVLIALTLAALLILALRGLV